MTKIFKSLADKQLISLLKNGAVGVLPTDTVYGLVCRADNQPAVKRLYGLKKREKKPGTVIAADIDQLVKLGLKYRYLKAVEQYWPGAVSIIIPTGNSTGNATKHLHFLTAVRKCRYLDLGRNSLAVRLPKGESLQKLLKQTGPLLTTSANATGKPPANNIAEAQKYFGNRIDFYVDGGDLSNRKPSTIIKIIDDEVEVIRQGLVNIDK